MEKEVYMVPNPAMPCQNLIFDTELCKGCNVCVEVCRTDVLMPNPEKGKPPIILYPDECWFCGMCVQYCSIPGAIKLQHPLVQRIVGWKRKATGKNFWLGIKPGEKPKKPKPPIG